jgi:hypothetical protein
LLVGLVLALLPGTSRAAPDLTEACRLVDFPKGNKKLRKPPQWFMAQIADKDRLEVVTEPGKLPPGYPCAFKFTVKPGDKPVGGSERAELSQSDVAPLGEGTELYYRWSTLFDPSTLPGGAGAAKIKSLVFTQWHHTRKPPSDISGAPPIDLEVRKRPASAGGGYILALIVRERPNQDAPPLWTHAVEPGKWYDFTFHVRFSKKKEGLVELWCNGEHYRREKIQTLYPEAPYVYVKQGLYRNDGIGTVNVVYHSPMLTGSSLEQVQVGAHPPPPPPPTDEKPPPPVQGTPSPVWSGDFSTGNLSQWSKVQSQDQRPGTERVKVEGMPAPLGGLQHAARFTVLPGDKVENGNRSQVLQSDLQKEGSEAFYGWATFFPQDYPVTPEWQVLVSWTPISGVSAAPIVLETRGDIIQLRLTSRDKPLWSAPLQRGSWHRFVLHLGFSEQPAQGFAELWYDDKQVLARTPARTGTDVYLKLGLNRDPKIPVPSTVFHTGMKRGNTREEVLPPP